MDKQNGQPQPLYFILATEQTHNNFMIDIGRLIRPKTVPLRSICLAKIDENMPNQTTLCHCDMCTKYELKKISQMQLEETKKLNEKIAIKAKNKHGVSTTFYLWVIKHLIIPHNKIITKGLEIFLPEILFYKEGEPNKMYCMREVDDPVIKVAHKEKLSSTFILKVFGDRRRKYREVVNTFLGKKKQVVIKKPSYGDKKQVKKQPKDGVIIKYTDALQQLISENQFLHLLQRRKQDPIWRQIYYIRNYIPVEDSLNRTAVTRFNLADIKYQEMYERAKTLMRVYGQNILQSDANYISDKEQSQFCKALLKNSIQIFCEYLLYKIVCFIQYFYDEKILEITAKFLVNQMGQGYLEDVMKLKTQSLIKYQWTNDAYLRKIDEEEQRVFFSKVVRTDEGIQKNATQIENYMSKTHQKMKQFYGLSMQEEDDHEQKANNQFFKLIHPQIQGPISEILRGQGMTVEKFKKDFLGYKPKKKQIVKPFNSNLIRSLHNITPQLHRADPHQYVKVPRRSVSTAFTRSSSSHHKSRSLNKAHSAYSTNMGTAFQTPRVFQK